MAMSTTAPESAPGAEARGHAEWRLVQPLVQTRHVCLHRFAHLIFCARIQVRQCPDCFPTIEVHLLGSDHLREQFFRAGLVGNLTQRSLIPEFGTESAVSMFLSEQRNITIEQVLKLSARFKLDANVFLPLPAAAKASK